MENLKKHLYELSVNLTETSCKDEVHIPSEIFKEVAIYEYLKIKNSDELILKEVKDDVADSIVSEVLRNYSQSLSHNKRATVDYKIFKEEYIYFWKRIREKKLTGENINLLKDIISKSKFIIGKEEYNGYTWTDEDAEEILPLNLKKFAKHYWHKSKITKDLVPFYIILYALIITSINDDCPIKCHQRAIINYKKHMNIDVMHALDWIVDCCVELYLNNEQSYLFNSKITVSGIVIFLERFEYSKYCIKEQFYTLLRALYDGTLHLKDSTNLLTEMRCVSFIEQIHSLFNGNKYKWKLVSKWLNPNKDEQIGLGYMSSDYRMIKKYLCEYFEIKDKKTNIEQDIFKTDSKLFTYYIDKAFMNDIPLDGSGNITNNSKVSERLDEQFAKINSNYLFSVVLLALDAPLDNYLSYISYAEVCDEIINTLPDIENSNNYREINGHSASMYFLLDTVMSERIFLLQTNELCSKIISMFKYVFENPEEIFSKKFIKEHGFLLNKTFDKVLLEIYLNIVLSFKIGG